MYEDKTLVCKECGNEFVFTAGEQEFYAERGFQNEPSAASPAVMPARLLPAVPGSTSLLSALLAAARPRFLSSLSPTVPFTAASALQRRRSSNRLLIRPERTPACRVSFLVALYMFFFGIFGALY